MSVKIHGVLRPSMIGDIIVSSIFPGYLEKLYPKSNKACYIDKKCSQIVPFLINHPYIDKIHVSEWVDRVSPNDELTFSGYDMVFDPFAQPRETEFYNKKSIVQATFEMNYLRGAGYINPNGWYLLSEDERKPKLNQWFDVEKRPGCVALWPFSGYNMEDLATKLRSPSIEWYGKLITALKADGKQIIQLGHPKSPLLEGIDFDYRSLSLFDAIKVSLGTDVMISTDSGVGWIAGAYGMRQVVLYTNYQRNHITNLDAYLPVNHQNNLISCYGAGGINNIDPEYVLECVNKF